MVGDRRVRARLTAALLDWYAANARRLVIRDTRDAYAILLGEVMSQQTQMARVGESLPAFLARFPTVAALAAATTGDVLRAWGGLGYPRRAVALRDAARELVARHAGRVPEDIAALEALPGIGPYTARAVASTAFGLPVTALDVNARRVIGRLTTGTPLPALVRPVDQARADALAPRERAADWNHALMDLGASVCRPVPGCRACPLRRWCAYATGSRAETWPLRATGPRSGTGPMPVRASRVPFHETNRYARGRVLALLRDALPGTWASLDAADLSIAPDRLARAIRELAGEGLIELAEPVSGESEGPVRARLADT
jgi:A/G-specific adenine glycosylase